MAGKQRAGKNSRVKVGATVLNFAEWSVNIKGDDLDTTNFEDGGRETGTIGVDVCEWSLKGDWDAGNNWIDPDPPGFVPRDDLEDLRLIVNVADDVFWDFPVSRVLSATNSTQVRGKVSFDASGKSNGAYTLPTGDK